MKKTGLLSTGFSINNAENGAVVDTSEGVEIVVLQEKGTRKLNLIFDIVGAVILN